MECPIFLRRQITYLPFKRAFKKNYVDVCFWNSAHLTQHIEFMVTEKRKMVKSLRYFSLEEIDDEVLIAVLQEAHTLKTKGFYKKKDID